MHELIFKKLVIPDNCRLPNRDKFKQAHIKSSTYPALAKQDNWIITKMELHRYSFIPTLNNQALTQKQHNRSMYILLLLQEESITKEDHLFTLILQLPVCASRIYMKRRLDTMKTCFEIQWYQLKILINNIRKKKILINKEGVVEYVKFSMRSMSICISNRREE